MKALLKTLWLLIKIVLMGALAVWVMQQQGSVAINLQQAGAPVAYEMPLPVVLAVLIVVLLLLMTVLRLFDQLGRLPQQMVIKRERKQLQDGYDALTKSLVAIAAGDGAGAEKLANQAAKKLGAPSISLLINAQAAQLQGDSNAAARFFHQLSSDPKAGFLGLRGQLMQEMKLALSSGQIEHARRLAAEAEAKEPRSPWVIQARFALEARAKNWREAEQVLARGMRFNAFSKEDNRWYLAALLLEQSREATTRDDARRLARRAVETAPQLTPAAVHYAETLILSGRRNTAADVIGKAWQQAPHPDLVTAWQKLFHEKHDDALARLKWLDKLLLLNDTDAEALVARADALLHAHLWGEARMTLMKLRQSTGDARCYALLAELERAEKGDERAAADWEHQGENMTQPQWVCKVDGIRSPSWTPLCPACGSFASQRWQSGNTALMVLG